METTMRFIRGQVWRWTDPIYGEKKDNRRKDIEVGEMTLRFNRYAIIIQDSETIDQHSILVIPCSSHKRYETDIRIDLKHVFSVTTTYAQPRKIFPAHPKMLDKYICTLPDDVMLDLDLSMLTLTNPSISSYLRNHGEEVVAKKIDDIYSKEYNKPKLCSIDSKEVIKAFIEENIVVSNSEVEIPISDIRDIFDKYCADRSIDADEIDMPMFVDSLCRDLNIDDFFHTDRYKYHHIKIKGIDLKGYNCDDDLDGSKPMWDIFRKKEFLAYLETNGIDKTAEAFGIKATTVSRYKSRFAKDISELDGDVTVSIENNPLNDEIINNDEMLKVISYMSNIVTNDIRARGMYRNYKKNFKGHHPMKESTYYKAIGNSIYYGLFGLFGIKERNAGSIVMQPIKSNHKYVKSVEALRTIYDVSTKRNISNGLDLMRAINTRGKEKVGISSDLIPFVKSQLNERLNIKPVAVQALLDKIRETYCR